MAISGDGKRATSGSKDRTVRAWDLETGKCVAIFEGHTDEVWGVAISRNGRYAISGSRDQTVRLSNIETGMWSRSIILFWGIITSVAISSDAAGSMLFLPTLYKTIGLWNI